LAASIYGMAIRLAIVASGRSASLLKHLSLDMEAGGPAINVAPEFLALLGPRLELRRAKLAAALESAENKSQIQGHGVLQGTDPVTD